MCVRTQWLPSLNRTADRKSLEERVAFVDDHMTDVFDSADHPLDVSERGGSVSAHERGLICPWLPGQQVVEGQRRPLAGTGLLHGTRCGHPIWESRALQFSHPCPSGKQPHPLSSYTIGRVWLYLFVKTTYWECYHTDHLYHVPRIADLCLGRVM